MLPAPLPSNENARLASLAALGLLDTPADQVFDSFVRVASEIAGVPIAALSLVAHDRQWFKSAKGLPGVTETPRDVSFCAHAILRPDEVLYVPDATQDPRFAGNPLVQGDPGIRFYAGAPVLDEHGNALGALCVIDKVPRTLAPGTLDRLADLARGASAAIQLHGALRALASQALRDTLTGLGNRRALEAALAQPPGPEGMSLLLLDLDHFKAINDTFGHPAGDLALQVAAARLSRVVRRRDVAYRLGGDEFALMLPEAAGAEAIEGLAQRIHAALADTFSVEGTPIPLRTSIGAAVMPGDSGTTGAGLVAMADRALYEAKRAGRGTTRIHRWTDSGSVSPARGVQRSDLKTLLRRAVVEGPDGTLSLALQPVTDLATRRVTSVEALVRWSPEPGFQVPPGEFVPLAERTGLAPHLDRWVLRAACAAAARWPQPLPVAVNISAVTFGLVDLLAMVKDVLASTGLPPKRLIIEMTETALAADAAQVRETMLRLTALGVAVALDDLGGGHASLLALRRFPFTKIKIDRSIITGLDQDPVAARTASYLADLGRMLGITVVAEGVETAGELRAVHAAGLERVQGFVLARPVPEAELPAAIRAAEEAVRILDTPAPEPAAAA